MSARLALLASLCLLAACADDGWSPRLICHNSNCVEPPEPDDDDTLDALEASLSLADGEGRPLIDGMEIDTFWFGAEARCIFAHDLENSAKVPAVVPAEKILEHLRALRREGKPLTRTGGPFVLFVELKGHVGPAKTELHDDAQRAAHAACALQLLDLLAPAAEQEKLPVALTFTSFLPPLLREVRAQLDARGWRDGENVSVRTGAILGLPPPLDSQNRSLEEFDARTGVSMVTAHPHWVSAAMRQAFASRDLELGYWMFSAVPETYAALENDRPAYVTTNEANALWRWLAERER